MHVNMSIYFYKQILLASLMITITKYKQYFEIFATTVGQIKITEIVLGMKWQILTLLWFVSLIFNWKKALNFSWKLTRTKLCFSLKFVNCLLWSVDPWRGRQISSISFFFFPWPWHLACGILVLPWGTEPMHLALEA